MTTQARELAKLVNNAGDLSFSDDIHFLSDAGVLTLTTAPTQNTKVTAYQFSKHDIADIEREQADVIARFHRNAGEKVLFLTGLDEHGQKVQQAAKDRNIKPKEHCDDMAPRFLDLWEKLHINYDDFIRTTENVMKL